MSDPVARAKAIAAETAVAEVAEGMLVGLGTGSTAAHAIAALGQRVAGGLTITAVATSLVTGRAAEAAGITVLDFADIARVDIGIDGADEVDPRMRAIKGGGGALLREKIVASSADRMICIVDAGKRVAQLGGHALPIEALPFARAYVMEAVRALGGEPRLRLAASGEPARSDQGNLLIDCGFGPIADPAALAAALDAVPGLLGHGLFLDQFDTVMIGSTEGVERQERARG